MDFGYLERLVGLGSQRLQVAPVGLALDRPCVRNVLHPPRWTMLSTQTLGSMDTTWIAARPRSFFERSLCPAREAASGPGHGFEMVPIFGCWPIARSSKRARFHRQNSVEGRIRSDPRHVLEADPLE